MSADSRMMSWAQSTRAFRRMYDAAGARYQLTRMTEEEYLKECTYITDCLILRALARSEMRERGHLPKLGEEQ